MKQRLTLAQRTMMHRVANRRDPYNGTFGKHPNARTARKATLRSLERLGFVFHVAGDWSLTKRGEAAFAEIRKESDAPAV